MKQGDKDAQSTKRLMELQMQELKNTYGTTKKQSGDDHKRTPQKAKIAKLYEDCAEYEAELEQFEKELEIVKEHTLQNGLDLLNQHFSDYEGDYEEEIRSALISGCEKNTQDPLYASIDQEIIRQTPIGKLTSTLSQKLSLPPQEIEEAIKKLLIARWQMLIEIKKEHIKEELAEMKLRGMKPNHIRRVYREYHGLD